MPARPGVPGRLHAGRPRADDHDPAPDGRRLVVAPLQLAAREWIVYAAHLAHLAVADLQAAGAVPDVVQPVLEHLAGEVRVTDVRLGHADDVQPVLCRSE